MPTESDTIAAAASPATRQSLAEDLRRLGVAPGMTLLVHTALSALGWIAGGPVALIQALQDVLTPEGTLVMPSHSGDLTDPLLWNNPPVPPEWVPIIREHMPAFDPALTPTRALGRTAELFRTWPGVLRSNHPHTSFAAWGKQAEFVTANQTLVGCLGEGSPLARIYDLDGHVLLLGVKHGNDTSLHLAEYRAGLAKQEINGAPVFENGVRVWKEIIDIELNSDVFEALGDDFERAFPVSIGRIALAEARLFPQRPAVDFAVGWLKDHQS